MSKVSSRKKAVKKPRKGGTKLGRKLIAGAKGAIKHVRKTVENDETCLQKHQKQWLDKTGLWSRLLIFHVANERKGGFGAQMHFKRMGVRPGVADWLVFPAGRSIAIENKDDEGTQNADQELFQKKWKAAGNLYLVVRTLDEFKSVINALVMF